MTFIIVCNFKIIYKLMNLFNFSDSDNPFRPEGELAKEAEEFVQQLKEQKEK